ncbi:MAG: hypothetical protein AAGC67_08600 [Myxococcota bacterium]
MKHPALIKRVRSHYEGRAFSPRLVDALCEEIERRTGREGVEIARGWTLPIEQVTHVFEPIDQAPRPAILHPAPAAILALSFGYRLDSPFARRPEDRQPGPNNVALAATLARCHRLFPEAWIGAQHEIGLALAEREEAPEPALVTPPRDWNTSQVLRHFVEHLPRYAFAGNRCVIVVSHLHHYGRCEVLLAREGLDAFPAPKEVAAYADYDPGEAQPRFRSPWEYLVNDFLALCKASSAPNARPGDLDVPSLAPPR